MAINETINQTAANGFSEVVNNLGDSIWGRFMDLISAPASHPNMIWIVTPLVVMLLLMQFYFGRYRREELGWNTAVGNSMVLIFVSIDLLRFVYGDTGVNSVAINNIPLHQFKATMVALVVGAAGFAMMFTNFFHILPKKFSFFMSSSLPVNLMAYISICMVYTTIPLDFFTLLAAFLLFVMLLVFFNVLRLVEPREAD